MTLDEHSRTKLQRIAKRVKKLALVPAGAITIAVALGFLKRSGGPAGFKCAHGAHYAYLLAGKLDDLAT